MPDFRLGRSLGLCLIVYCVLLSAVQVLSDSAENSEELIYEDCDKVVKGNICYTVAQGESPWEEAAAECRLRHNGRIASPTDAIESQALMEIISADIRGLDPDDSVWLGGHLTTDYDWRWLSGGYATQQGCYEISDTDASMVEMSYFGSLPNVDDCLDVCKNFTYFGIHAAEQSPGNYAIVCSCGDGYNAGEPAINTDCITPTCLGNYEPSTCFGTNTRRIYRITDIGGRLRDRDVQLWSNSRDQEMYANCGMLKQPSFTVARTRCNDNNAHICQYDLLEKVCNDTSGTMWVAGTCISLHTDGLTWHGARANCHTGNQTGELLTLSSVELHRVLMEELLPDTGKDWYIGLTNRQWTWDTTLEDIGVTGYEMWVERAPSYQLATTTKGCILASHLDGYSWITADCRTEARIICESGGHIAADNRSFTLPPPPSIPPSSSRPPPPPQTTSSYTADTSSEGDQVDSAGTSNTTAIVIGAVCGSLLLIILTLLVIMYCHVKKRRELDKNKANDMTPLENGAAGLDNPDGVYNSGFAGSMDRRATTKSNVYDEIPAHHFHDDGGGEQEGYEHLGGRPREKEPEPYQRLSRAAQESVRSGVYSQIEDEAPEEEAGNQRYASMNGSRLSQELEAVAEHGDPAAADYVLYDRQLEQVPEDTVVAGEGDSEGGEKSQASDAYLELMSSRPVSPEQDTPRPDGEDDVQRDTEAGGSGETEQSRL